MSEARRTELLRLAEQYGVPVFEDDCYADLIWNGKRPPALYAMSKTQNVIHCGSFSKSIAPALRVGFLVAPWAIMSRMLPLKTDAGSGALEQMVLAEYCAPHFTTHVPALRKALRAKLETLMETLNEQFGTAAEFDDPKGGIFLWVKLPDNVDTMKLYQAALKEGVAINPGPNGRPTRSIRGRACASASPARRSSRSARASRSSPRCAARSSACRRAARTWSARGRSMYVTVNGARLYFDVEGAGLVPDGPRMREKPTLLLLHGGPGFDHTMYKPAFSQLADIAQVIYSTTAARAAAAASPRPGPSRSGATT